MGKIILVDNNAKMLLNFRSNFILELVKLFQVIVVCPMDNVDEDKLYRLGVSLCIKNTNLSRQGINPLKEYKLLKFYENIFKQHKPDIVFNYTIKCAIWSSIAANKVGIKRIFSMITGLGYAFTDINKRDIKKQLINICVKQLYKKSLKCNKKVFFLNPDDKNLFSELGTISQNQFVVLNGEGVDLDYFYYVKDMPNKFTVVVLSRLLKEKGIIEYYQAAKILKKKYTDNIIFRLAGSIDDNPSSLTQQELDEIIASGAIEYLGNLEDVREVISQSSLLLLSSYREGTPRCILEAMSMGRAIITTDTPGCRETVVNGKNGYLIAVKNTNDIVSSIDKLFKDRDLLEQMGKRSRKIAETKYNVKRVNQIIINELMVG